MLLILVKSILSQCRLLDFDPEKRPSATECMHHPFVSSYGVLINEEKLVIPASIFTYEKQKLTVDILRQEILRESKYMACFIFIIVFLSYFVDVRLFFFS